MEWTAGAMDTTCPRKGTMYRLGLAITAVLVVVGLGITLTFRPTSLPDLPTAAQHERGFSPTDSAGPTTQEAWTAGMTDPDRSKSDSSTGELRGWELRRRGLTPASQEARLLSEQALNAESPKDRMQALRGLTNLDRSPEIETTLRSALKDPDPAVRIFSLSLLPKLGDKEFLATVQQVAATDPSPRVRERAKQLYEYFSKENLATPEPGS